MNARDHALGLLAAIKNNDTLEFERLLKELEESCHAVATTPGNWARVKAGFAKWKATYLALRMRNDDKPPPEPFYFSGPYLTLLKTVISKREFLGEERFRYMAADVALKARHVGAHRCVMFHTLYHESMGHDTDHPVFHLQETLLRLFDDKKFIRTKSQPNDLYNDYLYGTGYCIEDVSSEP